MRALACFFFFSSRRRHTRFKCDWSSDVCSSDLARHAQEPCGAGGFHCTLDWTTQIHRGYVGAQADSTLPAARADHSARSRAPFVRTRRLPCGHGHQSSAHWPLQEVRLAVKVLVLFDLARPPEADETFSPQELK